MLPFPSRSSLIDKVLPSEESSKVEDLPHTQTCEREHCEPCKVLDPGIG